MLLFALSIFLVPLLGFGQLNRVFSIGGVQANLCLVFIITYAFFDKDWLRRSALILLAFITLSFEPLMNFQALFVLLVFFMSTALVDYIKWQPFLNGIFVIILATFLISLESFYFGTLIPEIVFNLSAGVLLALLLGFVNSRIKHKLNA